MDSIEINRSTDVRLRRNKKRSPMVAPPAAKPRRYATRRAAACAAVLAALAAVSGCGSETVAIDKPGLSAAAPKQTVLALSEQRGLLGEAMVAHGWAFQQIAPSELASKSGTIVYVDVTSPAFKSKLVQEALKQYPGPILFDSHDQYELPIVGIGDDGTAVLLKNGGEESGLKMKREELAEQLFYSGAVSDALLDLYGSSTPSTAVLKVGERLTPIRVSSDGKIDGQSAHGRLNDPDAIYSADTESSKTAGTAAQKVGAQAGGGLLRADEASVQVDLFSTRAQHDLTRWGVASRLQASTGCLNTQGPCQRIVQGYIKTSGVTPGNDMKALSGIRPRADACRSYRLGTFAANGFPNGTTTAERLRCTWDVSNWRVNTYLPDNPRSFNDRGVTDKSVEHSVLIGPYADYFTYGTQISLDNAAACATLRELHPSAEDVNITDDTEQMRSETWGWNIGASLSIPLTGVGVPASPGISAGYSRSNSISTKEITRHWDVKNESSLVTGCGNSGRANSRMTLTRKTNDKMMIDPRDEIWGSGPQGTSRGLVMWNSNTTFIDSPGPDYYWTTVIYEVEKRMPAASVYGWGSDHVATYGVTEPISQVNQVRTATITGKVGVGLEYLQFSGILVGKNYWDDYATKVGAFLSGTSGYNRPVSGKFVQPKLGYEIWSSVKIKYMSNPK